MKKDFSEKEMSGMTVNERLFLSGSVNEFDEAVAQKDEVKLKSILQKIYLSQENIQIIIEQELS
ncbi:hypothetical protein BH20ACI4_BH20ACI4_22490 [soil metagenome]